MRAWLARRAVFLFSLAALAVALWLTPAVWVRLDTWVQNQRDQVWAQLEDLLGQKVVYRRIAPNVLAALDFQDVRLLADDGTTVFRAASVRLSWDWGLLFQGRIGEALRRVQVINASLTLDAHRDRALLEHWASLFRPSGAGGSTAFDFQLEGFNLEVHWTDGLNKVSLERGFATLSPEAHEWGLKYRGSLSWETLEAKPRSARLSVRGELRADSAFQNLSLRAEMSAVRTSWVDLEPVTVQVTIDPQLVTVAKVSDRMPLDVQVVWDRERDRWTVKGAAERFQPSQLARVKLGRLWSGLAEGTVSGRFVYEVGGDFSFSGEASWLPGSLPEPLAANSLHISGDIASVGREFRFTHFSAQTPDLAFRFEGNLAASNFLPEGSLVLERWSTPGGGVAAGTVVLERFGSLVSFSGKDWTWSTLGTSAPYGWVESTPEGWKFSIQGPVDGTAEGRFGATGVVDPSGPKVDAAVELLAFPVSVLRAELHDRLPSIDLPAEIWALETTLQGRLEWAQESGPALAVTSFAFYDPLIPNRAASGSALWRGQHLDLAVNPSSWDAVRAAGTLQADLEADGSANWTLVGTLWNHPFDLAGRWVPADKTLAFSGSPGIAAVVHQNDAGLWRADVTLQPLEILPGWVAGFQGWASLQGSQWQVHGEQVSLSGRYPWNQEPFTARSQVTADADFVRLDEATVVDTHGSWAGSALTSWSADFSSPWAGRLALATAAGIRESVTLDWVATEVQRWHLAVKAAGLDITRAGVPALDGLVGRLAAAGTAEWDGTNAQWTLQTALSEARWGDSPLGLRANLNGTLHQLSIRSLNLSVNPIRLVDASADIDLDAQTWKSALNFGLRVGPGDWESRLALAGVWSGQGTDLEVSGALASTSNTWAQRSFEGWGMRGRWSPRSWEASLTDADVSVRGTADGSFVAEARSPFPVQGTVNGAWSAGLFQANVSGFWADLALVKDLVNSKLFAVTGGTAEGDFTVGGSPADPEVNGTLLLRGLSATSSFVGVPVGPVDIPVILDGHRLRVDPVDIGPGEQTWMVSGGARLDHLLPEEYQFSIQTDTLSVIPALYQYTGLSATGGVNGLLVVKGSPLAVTLGGRLVLQDAVITLRPSQAEATSGDPLGFNADLTLITGRKVEFLWPNETLPLLRAVTAAGQIITIKANDVASTWSVNGKLGLRTGEINYLNRTFVLKEGQLLLQEDQTKFDPRVTVRAEWRLREAEGPVTIGLRADGTLSAFSPRFDASPYKSPDELQRLVGTTLGLPTDYTRSTNLDTALSLASDVGTSFLLTPFENTVKKNFQLDLFTVKTEILKKSLLGRDASGNTSLEASDYLDNTRLFFGKYIGDDLFLQGTLAFRRDSNVATQDSPKMVVEPELQMEFQTPFFLLNWTLLPQHPETLFVTDNTVTFRWNWSY